MNGAECAMKAAKDAGIEVCFANPGTTELPLVVALDTVGGIRPVLGLFEGVCTGAADGYARMLQKPVMVLLHLGPGLANGIANLHNAKRAHSKIVTVVGEHSTWHRASDPPLAMDIESLAKTVSGWQRTCVSCDWLGQDMADAVEAADKGQIATLIVPFDLQTEKCGSGAVVSHKKDKQSVSIGAVKTAATLLREGKKTALMLGNKHIGRKELMAAARIKQACGCDLITENFPAHIMRGAGLPDVIRVPYLPEMAVDMLSKYEVFVFAGAKEPVSFFGYEGIPPAFLKEEQQKFHLSTPDQDLLDVLDILADELDAPKIINPNLLASLKIPEIPTGALTPNKICAVIAALQPEGAIVVEESVTTGLMYYTVTLGVAPFDLMTLTGGAIGQGAPCAMGAAIACPDRPVINFQADGSGMYTLQALWTEAREKLNVTTLICSNSSYDILKVEYGRLKVTPGKSALRLTDLTGIDWVSLGKGMGVPSVKVTTADELSKELGRALNEPGPHLIQMII
ncbi:MAG: acetolactate synthase large subunit [Smithella sp.]|jgi:acetolactate synthase I/II/III large subunit